MKKLLYVLAAAVITAALLCACSHGDENSSQVSSPIVDSSEAAPPETSSASSSDSSHSSNVDSDDSSESTSTDTSADESSDTSLNGTVNGSGVSSEDTSDAISSADLPMDEDKVYSAFLSAVEFMDYWYQGGNADAMDDKTVVDYQGFQYCPYSADGIDSFDDLRNEALTMVSPDVFESWQERIEYTDIDGRLCGPVNYGRKTAQKEYRSECRKIADDEYELRVGVYCPAEYVTGSSDEDSTMVGEFMCEYHRLDEGWVFTAFSYRNVNNFAG